MGHSGELNKQKIRIVTQGFRTRQTMAFSVQFTFLHLIAIMNYDTNSLERIRLFKQCKSNLTRGRLPIDFGK